MFALSYAYFLHIRKEQLRYMLHQTKSHNGYMILLQSLHNRWMVCLVPYDANWWNPVSPRRCLSTCLDSTDQLHQYISRYGSAHFAPPNRFVPVFQLLLYEHHHLHMFPQPNPKLKPQCRTFWNIDRRHWCNRIYNLKMILLRIISMTGYGNLILFLGQNVTKKYASVRPFIRPNSCIGPFLYVDLSSRLSTSNSVVRVAYFDLFSNLDLLLVEKYSFGRSEISLNRSKYCLGRRKV